MELDAQPADKMELNAARLSRYELVDMMYKEGFEDLVRGWLRLIRQSSVGSCL